MLLREDGQGGAAALRTRHSSGWFHGFGVRGRRDLEDNDGWGHFRETGTYQRRTQARSIWNGRETKGKAQTQISMKEGASAAGWTARAREFSGLSYCIILSLVVRWTN